MPPRRCEQRPQQERLGRGRELGDLVDHRHRAELLLPEPDVAGQQRRERLVAEGVALVLERVDDQHVEHLPELLPHGAGQDPGAREVVAGGNGAVLHARDPRTPPPNPDHSGRHRPRARGTRPGRMGRTGSLSPSYDGLPRRRRRAGPDPRRRLRDLGPGPGPRPRRLRRRRPRGLQRAPRRSPGPISSAGCTTSTSRSASTRSRPPRSAPSGWCSPSTTSPDVAYEMNVAAARIAKESAEEWSTPSRPRWVVGSIGPGTRLPSLGAITFDALRDRLPGAGGRPDRGRRRRAARRDRLRPAPGQGRDRSRAAARWPTPAASCR